MSFVKWIVAKMTDGRSPSGSSSSGGASGEPDNEPSSPSSGRPTSSRTSTLLPSPYGLNVGSGASTPASSSSHSHHHHHNYSHRHLNQQLGGAVAGGGHAGPTGQQLLLQKFYEADDHLNFITNELDSFDGRKEPSRCTNLVNQLRSAQDKVICLLFQLMDEWGCTRSDRGYRLKFPDDLVAGGENGESLNGQIWFGAECLASGSNIMNHESESESLRPMAKMLTNRLESLRMDLRSPVTKYLNDMRMLSKGPLKAPAPKDLVSRCIFTTRDDFGMVMMDKLEGFDTIFADFEYNYVKAMLPIKTAEEIERLHELTVLFSEAVAYSLKKGLIMQEDINECHPHVLIAIPRLTIVYGLVYCVQSPIWSLDEDQLSNMFKHYHLLLQRIRDLLCGLRHVEIEVLERLLTNEDSDASSSGVTDAKTLAQVASEATIKDLVVTITPEPEVITTTTTLNDPPSNTLDTIGDIKIDVPNRTCSLPPMNQVTHHTVGDGQLVPVPPCDLRHRRRHSDPVSCLMQQMMAECRMLHTSTSSLSLVTTCKEKRERTTRMSFSQEDDDDHETSSSKEETSGHEVAGASPPTDDEGSTESLDFAINSTGSKEQVTNHQATISPATRQVLHKLFVTIAMVADQLQSNHASDLRVILSQVFSMYTSDEDGDGDNGCDRNGDTSSVEEALEAKEDAASSSSTSSPSFPSSCSSTSSADSPITQIGSDSEDHHVLRFTSTPSFTPTAAPSTVPPSDLPSLPPSAPPDIMSSHDMGLNHSVQRGDHYHVPHGHGPSMEHGGSMMSQRRPHDPKQTRSHSSRSGRSRRRAHSEGGDLHHLHPQPQPNHGMQHQHPAPQSHYDGPTLGQGDHHPQVRHHNHQYVVNHPPRHQWDTMSSPLIPPPHAPHHHHHHQQQMNHQQPEPSNDGHFNFGQVDQEVEHLMAAPIWMPDELVGCCTKCDQSFNLIRRRHHCRNCGDIYCNPCSNNFLPLTHFGYYKPVRVCDRCFNLLTRPEISGPLDVLNLRTGQVNSPSGGAPPTMAAAHRHGPGRGGRGWNEPSSSEDEDLVPRILLNHRSGSRASVPPPPQPQPHTNVHPV